MMRWIATIGMIGMIAVLTGCNTLSGQPKITRAMMEPDTLQLGDSAVITVKVSDRHGVVDRVEGYVVEDPRLKFNFKDDGVAPDEKAGDGVWTFQVDVPFQAPSGAFSLEVIAYRADGLPVQVRDKQRNVLVLKETIPLMIDYVQ